MKMYKLRPEVPGGIGEKSIIEYEGGKIKSIQYLEYIFEDWFGDELLTSSPCYIITESLAQYLQNKKLSGFNLDESIEISKSEIFEYYHPNMELPKFLRLKVSGVVEIDGVLEIENAKISKWSGHDFCLYRNVSLYVSERALNVLKESGKMKNFDCTEMEVNC